MRNMVVDVNVGALDGEYKVMVKCPTYNHSRYICDALNGFAIQQTDFPFICVVVDDASTDGAQDVIKQYANDNCNMSQVEQTENELSFFIKVAHKENKNCTFLFCFLKQNLYRNPKKQEIYKPWRAHCKYEALCEGDDYWINPAKLQMQVNMMDSHPECSLCYHACHNLYEEDYCGWRKNFGEEVKKEYTFEDVAGKYNFQSATILYRPEIFMSDLYKQLSSLGFTVGDILIYIVAAHEGKIFGFKETMSVYRRNNSGVSKNAHSVKGRYINTEAFIKALDFFSKEEREVIIKKRICNNLLNHLSPFNVSIGRYLHLYYLIFLKSPKWSLKIMFKCFKRFLYLIVKKIIK